MKAPDLPKPVGRWNPETRAYEEYKEVSPPPPPSYRGSPGCQAFGVDVPLRLAKQAEELGLDVPAILRAGVRVALVRAVQQARQDTNPGPHSRYAAECRALLGDAIGRERRKQGLSRSTLRAFCLHVLPNTPTGRFGWSEQSLAAWETGRSTPPSVEPLIMVFKLPVEKANQWRIWWMTCRSGQPTTEDSEREAFEAAEARYLEYEQEAIDANPDLAAELGYQTTTEVLEET